jgi:hypothetical protein
MDAWHRFCCAVANWDQYPVRRLLSTAKGDVSMTTSSSPIAVTLPNGREATFDEMQSYRQILLGFIRDQEALLPQVEDSRRHNEIIDYLRILADGYNEQLGLFKAAEAQRQQQLLVAMIRVVGG